MPNETPTSTAPITEAVETTEEQAPENTDESTESVEASEEPSKEEKEIKTLENKKNLTKKETQKLNKLRLKVDGKEIDEELPFDLPPDPKAVEYLKKELQMSKMAGRRSQDFSALQKEAAQFIERLRSNPFEVLRDPELGIDIQAAVKGFIEQELENQKKSPEQLEKEKLETELKKLQTERETEKKALQEREFELLQEKAEEEYDRQISEAVEKSTLPKSPYIIKRVADWMLMGLQEGLDVKAEDVIPLVEAQMKSDLQEMFSVMPAEVIESLIGKEKLGKIRKTNIAKAKQVLSSKAPDVGKSKEEKNVDPKDKKSFREFFGV